MPPRYLLLVRTEASTLGGGNYPTYLILLVLGIGFWYMFRPTSLRLFGLYSCLGIAF